MRDPPAAELQQYRGEPRHLGLAPEDAQLAGPLTPVWRSPKLGIGSYSASKSSPAVDDWAAYVGADDGRLYALDRETGMVLWAFTTRRHDEERADPPLDGAYTGIHGSPACDGERVYIGDYAGWLSAVDRRTGALVWERRLGGSIGSSPVITHDALYIAVEYPIPEGRVFALSPRSGEITFASDWLGHHPHASVSVLGPALVVGTNAGELLRLAPPRRSPVLRVATGGAIKSTAALADDGEGAVVAFATSFDAHLYAVDLASGNLRFRVETGAPSRSSPSVAEGRVVFGSDDGAVRCLDTATGTQLWSVETGSPLASSPTLVTASRLVVIGTSSGDLLGLDFDRGTELFRVPLGAPVTSVPVVAGSSVFINDDTGTVHRLDPHR